MGWVSPTGFVDPDTAWGTEENAYDGNTGTFADSSVPAESWGSFLELTHAALSCDKVRFYAEIGPPRIDEIDVDVFYESDWHNVYEGSYAGDEWVEKTIPAGTKSVTAARIRFHNSHDSNQACTLWEFEFNEAAVLHEWEGSDGIAIGEALVKTPMKMLVDGFQFSDVTIKEFYKVLTDPIAFTDTLVSVKTILRTFVDGIAFTDVVSKMVSKILSDGIKFTDCLTRWRWLAAIRNLVRRRCNQPSIREQDAVDDGNI